MRQYLHRGERFRNTVRNGGLSAVIHRAEAGLHIELSDGRTCSMSYDAFGPTTNAMNAAVRWARRNGATTVEILK